MGKGSVLGTARHHCPDHRAVPVVELDASGFPFQVWSGCSRSRRRQTTDGQAAAKVGGGEGGRSSDLSSPGNAIQMPSKPGATPAWGWNSAWHAWDNPYSVPDASQMTDFCIDYLPTGMFCRERCFCKKERKLPGPICAKREASHQVRVPACRKEGHGPCVHLIAIAETLRTPCMMRLVQSESGLHL